MCTCVGHISRTYNVYMRTPIIWVIFNSEKVPDDRLQMDLFSDIGNIQTFLHCYIFNNPNYISRNDGWCGRL